jgi:hypothetical protein
MAFSFCCAPLHAARKFAQPPQGAEMIRNYALLKIVPRYFPVGKETNLKSNCYRQLQ